MNQHRKNVSITVSGRVQGVFFRASTKKEADRLAIKGFVRNESDGSVFIEAEGEVSSVDGLVRWCHKGPSAARVDQCVVRDGSLKGYTSFEVDRGD